MASQVLGAPRSLRSILGWHILAAIGIFARRYELFISGACSIAICGIWLHGSGTDYSDLLVYNYLLQDLVRHGRKTDAIGNHATINITITCFVHAMRKMFPQLLSENEWNVLTFFSPLFCNIPILQLWVHRSISTLERLDRDFRKRSLLLLEKLLLKSLTLHSSSGGRDAVDFGASNLQDHQYPKFKGNELEHRIVLLYPRLAFWPIRCSLIHFSHKSTVWYEAISYKWGESEETETIILDGCRKKVTRSVYEILSRQSSIFMPKLLWIDGLCINQNDKDEKRSQVTYMDSIYSQATFVTVFLSMSTSSYEHENQRRSLFQYRYDGISGLSSDEATRLHYQEARWAADFLNEIKILEKKFKYDENDDKLYRSLSYPLWEGQKIRWEYLLKLLDHPWFERVWIVQEVALAKYVRVVYGDEVIIWDRFVSSLKTLQKNRRFEFWIEYWHQLHFREHRSLNCINRIDEHRETFQKCSEWSRNLMGLSRSVSISKLVADPTNPADMELLPKLRDLKIEFLRTSKEIEEILKDRVLGDRVPPSLAHLLSDSFYFKASDPKDSIYGLMAICNNPMEVDYNVSLEQVYIAASKAVLEQHGLHLILHAAGIGGRGPTSGQISALPTWVPDWRHPPRNERLLSQGEDGSEKEFTAGGAVSPKLQLTRQSTLKMSGILVDSVDKLWNFALGDTTLNNSFPLIDMLRFSIAYIKLRSELMNLVDEKTLYPHVEPQQSMLEAFRRTLIADKRYLDNKESCIDAQSIFEEMERLLVLVVDSIKGDDPDAQYIFEALVGLIRVMGPMKTACAGRHFFISEKGYFGLCPPDALKGDHIYVVPGVHVPVVLRPSSAEKIKACSRDQSKNRSIPSSKKVDLVGECFVHGLMRGEALSLEVAKSAIEIL